MTDISSLQTKLKNQAAAIKRQSTANNNQTRRIKALEDEVVELKAVAVRQEADHVQLGEFVRLVYIHFPAILAKLVEGHQAREIFWHQEFATYALEAQKGGCDVDELVKMLAKKPPEVYLGLLPQLQSLMTVDAAAWVGKNANKVAAKQRAIQRQLGFKEDSDAGSQQEPPAAADTV